MEVRSLFHCWSLSKPRTCLKVLLAKAVTLLRGIDLAFVTIFRGMSHFTFYSQVEKPLDSWREAKSSRCEQLETGKVGHTVGLRFLAVLKLFFPLPIPRKLLWCSVSNWDGCVWKSCIWLKSRWLGGSDVPVLWVWEWELDHPMSVFTPLWSQWSLVTGTLRWSWGGGSTSLSLGSNSFF